MTVGKILLYFGGFFLFVAGLVAAITLENIVPAFVRVILVVASGVFAAAAFYLWISTMNKGRSDD